VFAKMAKLQKGLVKFPQNNIEQVSECQRIHEKSRNHRVKRVSLEIIEGYKHDSGGKSNTTTKLSAKSRNPPPRDESPGGIFLLHH
jgi:hypothetical protein